MIIKPGQTIYVNNAYLDPIIRRDTNTVMLVLTQDETLQLIGDLVSGLKGGSNLSRVMIESDQIYSKNME